MPLDIVRIRPAGDGGTPATKEEFLNAMFLLEAVAPVALLDRLRALGFDPVPIP